MRAYRVFMVVLILALVLSLCLGCGKKKVPDTGLAGEGAGPAVPIGEAGMPLGEEGLPMPGEEAAVPAQPPGPMGGGDLVSQAMADKDAGRLDQAVMKFQAALAENLDNEDAQYGLAWTLALQGNKSQAIAEFEKVLGMTENPERIAEAEAAIERLQ